MPLTIGPHSITIINDDGTEMKYGTKNCDSKTVRIKYSTNEFEFSTWLKERKTSHNCIIYTYTGTSLFDVTLYISPIYITLELDDLLTIHILYNNTTVTIRDLSKYRTEHYYCSGLDVTDFYKCVYLSKYSYGSEDDKLIALILVAAQLDACLLDNLLKWYN